MKAPLIPVLVAALVFGSCGGGGTGVTPPVEPNDILDQSNVPSAFTLTVPVGPSDVAQTFRVGVTGRLTKVQLVVSATMIPVPGTLRIDVRPTNAGNPLEDDGSALGFVELDTIDLPIMPTLLELDFFVQNIQVQNNQRLAIVARRTAGIDIVAQIHGSAADVYANGTVVRRPAGATWMQTAGDVGFQTFVEP